MPDKNIEIEGSDAVWVYVAGPFTAEDPQEHESHIRDARRTNRYLAEAFYKLGQDAAIICPHTMGAGLEETASPEWWYRSTLTMLARCEALVLTQPQDSETVVGSRGTQLELDFAKAEGKLIVDPWNYNTVFEDIAEAIIQQRHKRMSGVWI